MPAGEQLIEEGVRAERAGALDRALESFEAAIEVSSDPGVRSEAYTRIADIRREQCHWDEGLQAARAAQAIARDAGLDRAFANARIAEGNVMMIHGEFAAAMEIFRELAESQVDPRLRGIALQNVGSMQAQLGQFGAAERSFQESLGNFQRAGYHRGQVIALNNLGRLAIDRRAFDEAPPLLERAMREAEEIEDADLRALAGQNLASALLSQGHTESALDLASEALGYFTSCGNHYREIECLRLIGSIHERLRDRDAARRCYDRALELSERIESDVEIRVTRHRLAELERLTRDVHVSPPPEKT